jgi:hypothetical protein
MNKKHLMCFLFLGKVEKQKPRISLFAGLPSLFKAHLWVVYSSSHFITAL